MLPVVIATLVIVGSSTVAFSQGIAADPCTKPVTQSAMNECSYKWAQQDQVKLDALLKELGAVLEKSELARLVSVQKAWVGYREAHCAWQASFFEGGSIQPSQRSACLSLLTWNRIDELKVNLCEGNGLTGECVASRRYVRPQR